LILKLSVFGFGCGYEMKFLGRIWIWKT